jgi:hypothetical protein
MLTRFSADRKYRWKAMRLLDEMARKPWVTCLSFLCLGILVYWPLLFLQEPTNPDGQYIFPILKSTTSLTDYLTKLSRFQTLDFQPVRDLSLYLDYLILQKTQLNISIFHNLMIWVSICWLLMHLILRIFPAISRQEAFLLSLMFLAYPLFTQTVSWGVARKHLLMMLFSIGATYVWVSPKIEYKLAKTSIVSLLYIASVLSQPIFILWPVWAATYQLLYRRTEIKASLKVLVPLFLLLMVLGITNYLYYETSNVFLSIYPKKTDEMFDFSDQLLAIGHYFFQIFFPFLLTFSYTLGHWSTLVGLILIGIFTILLLRLKVDRRLIFTWSLFGALPLAMMITKPTTIFDTYLLVPAAAVLFLLIAARLPRNVPGLPYYYLGLMALFTTAGHLETYRWMDDIRMSGKNFERRPSCWTAFEYLRMNYENDQLPQNTYARPYLLQTDCGRFMPGGISMVNMHTYLLYYESDLPDDQRLQFLRERAGLGVIPAMSWPAYLIKLGREEEAVIAVEYMKKRLREMNYPVEYIPLATKLAPFCRIKQDQECLELIEPFIAKRPLYQ